jgi:hypothetical protein
MDSGLRRNDGFQVNGDHFYTAKFETVVPAQAGTHA